MSDQTPSPFPRDAVAPGRLPDGFEPELVRLDEALARLARRERAAVPADLASRTFAASRHELAGGRRLAGDGPVPIRRSVAAAPVASGWAGRLAFAACLGLLCLAGWWTARPAIGPDANEGSMLADATVSPSPEARLVLLHDVPWTVADEVEAIDRQVASLLETGGLSSFDEVRGEIDALFPDWATASIAD